MKRTIVLVGLAAASICAAVVYAESGTEMPGMRHRHMMGAGPGRLIPLLLRTTDLTPDQDKQAHQILDADRTAVEGLFTQLHQANKDLANLLLSPEVQADAVATQQALIAQLQQQLAQHQTSRVMAIRALLRPEQLAKANAARDQWKAWHGDKHSCGQNAS